MICEDGRTLLILLQHCYFKGDSKPVLKAISILYTDCLTEDQVCFKGDNGGFVQ